MDSILIKKDKFTIIPNDLIRSTSVTAAGKAVYAYLMSRPDGWQFYKAEILNNFKEGRDAINNALRCLREHGWVSINQSKTSDGKFGLTNFEIHWEPIHQSNVDCDRGLTANGKPVHGKSDNGKPATNNTDSTNTEVNKRKKQKKEKRPDFDVKASFLENAGDFMSEEDIDGIIILRGRNQYQSGIGVKRTVNALREANERYGIPFETLLAIWHSKGWTAPEAHYYDSYARQTMSQGRPNTPTEKGAIYEASRDNTVVQHKNQPANERQRLDEIADRALEDLLRSTFE